jgi:hypothetical protein
MSRDEERTETPAGEEGRPVVPKSAAAAAARRARRIGGPARTARTGRTAQPAASTAEPEAVDLARAGAGNVPAEPVSETHALSPAAEPSAETVRIPVSRPEDDAATVPVWLPPAPDIRTSRPPASAGPSGWAVVRWVPAAVLVAAAVAMGILLLTFSHSVWWAKPSSATVQRGATKPGGGIATVDGPVNQLRERVLAAAKECVVATNKYDYTTLDADEAAGVKCTTGVQTARYKSAMDHLIRPTATKLKASQVPQINTAGIESVTDGGKQWSIVVYGQLGIHNVNVKSRTDPFAAVVRMDYVRGKWLMSDVQTLSEPNS